MSASSRLKGEIAVQETSLAGKIAVLKWLSHEYSMP